MAEILIVEDEEPISNLIKMSLKKAGYQCRQAFDGYEAADCMEKDRFDLICRGSMAMNCWNTVN